MRERGRGLGGVVGAEKNTNKKARDIKKDKQIMQI